MNIMKWLSTTLIVVQQGVEKAVSPIIIEYNVSLWRKIRKQRDSEIIYCDVCGREMLSANELGLVFEVNGEYKVACDSFNCTDEALDRYGWED